MPVRLLLSFQQLELGTCLALSPPTLYVRGFQVQSDLVLACSDRPGDSPDTNIIAVTGSVRG